MNILLRFCVHCQLPCRQLTQLNYQLLWVAELDSSRKSVAKDGSHRYVQRPFTDKVMWCDEWKDIAVALDGAVWLNEKMIAAKAAGVVLSLLCYVRLFRLAFCTGQMAVALWCNHSFFEIFGMMDKMVNRVNTLCNLIFSPFGGLLWNYKTVQSRLIWIEVFFAQVQALLFCFPDKWTYSLDMARPLHSRYSCSRRMFINAMINMIFS